MCKIECSGGCRECSPEDHQLVADDQFIASAEEMLACFRGGYVDCVQNFESPYEWNSMRNGAWLAGYALAWEKQNVRTRT